MNSFESSCSVKSYDYPIPKQWASAVIDRFNSKIPNGFTVDVGCGPGQFLSPMANALNNSVIGVDISAAMLTQAALKKHNGHLVKASAVSMPFADSSVNLALMRYIIHHLKDWRPALFEARRIICNGGVLLIETANIKGLMMRPEYSLFEDFKRASLARWPNAEKIMCFLRKIGFSNVEFFEIKLVRDELDPLEYLNRMHQWSIHGGGTSFWRSLQSSDRVRYFNFLSENINRMTVDGRLPIFTDSLVLVAM